MEHEGAEVSEYAKHEEREDGAAVGDSGGRHEHLEHEAAKRSEDVERECAKVASGENAGAARA